MKLLKLLKPEDIIINGANAFYQDARAQAKWCDKKGVHLFDIGVSGGIHGLKNGYTLMIGGPKSQFKYIEHFCKALAPSGGYGYFGEVGAGHFVKSVHNIVEYVYLQGLAEGVELLANFDQDIDVTKATLVWHPASVIRSWLLDLTSQALSRKDFNNIKPDIESVTIKELVNTKNQKIVKKIDSILSKIESVLWWFFCKKVIKMVNSNYSEKQSVLKASTIEALNKSIETAIEGAVTAIESGLKADQKGKKLAELSANSKAKIESKKKGKACRSLFLSGREYSELAQLPKALLGDRLGELEKKAVEDQASVLSLSPSLSVPESLIHPDLKKSFLRIQEEELSLLHSSLRGSEEELARLEKEKEKLSVELSDLSGKITRNKDRVKFFKEKKEEEKATAFAEVVALMEGEKYSLESLFSSVSEKIETLEKAISKTKEEIQKPFFSGVVSSFSSSVSPSPSVSSPFAGLSLSQEDVDLLSSCGINLHGVSLESETIRFTRMRTK